MFIINPGPIETGRPDHFNGDARSQIDPDAQHDFPIQYSFPNNLHFSISLLLEVVSKSQIRFPA
jgi:hypothetical protein